MKIYFAGPLFTQAERFWNERVGTALTEFGYDVFLPQTEVKEVDTLDADTVFQIDVNGVKSADVVVAILDGPDADSGTSFECGVAYALGIPIIAVRSDLRGGGEKLPNQRMTTVNLMLAQAVSAVVDLPDPETTFDALVSAIVSALKGIE